MEIGTQGKGVDFNDILVGEDLGMYRYRMTAGRILKYRETIGADCPWYTGDSPFGGPIAPPTVCDGDHLWHPGNDRILLSPDGTLRKNIFHASLVYEFINPARAGTEITVTGRVVDKYEKRGRFFVVTEWLSVDDDGRDILRHTSTYCWEP